MATLVSDPHGVDGVPGGAGERDAALAEGLRAGRRDAFERLYELYRGRIYSLTLRIVKSPEDACDITQDVFVKAFRKLPDSPVSGLHLMPWLCRVAVNASYDHLRTRRVHRPIDDIGAEARPEPVDTLEQAEMGRLVEESLAALSARHRTVLVLKDIHGLRHGEIAEILGVSKGATETLLYRARQAFRAAYLDLTHGRPGSRSVEKWSAAGIGIGMFLHEVPLPPALQGGFPFGAAAATWAGATTAGGSTAGATAAGGAAGGGAAGGGAVGATAAGVAAGGAGIPGGSSAGLTLAAGGLLAKVGGAVSLKVATAVIAASCAAGGGVAAYETGALPGPLQRAPEQARVHAAPAADAPRHGAREGGSARGKAALAPGASRSAAERERTAAAKASRDKKAGSDKPVKTSAGAGKTGHGKSDANTGGDRSATRAARGEAPAARSATNGIKAARSATSAGKPDDPGRPVDPGRSDESAKPGETD